MGFSIGTLAMTDPEYQPLSLDADVDAPLIKLLARVAKRPIERLLHFDAANNIYHTLPQDDRPFEARGLARLSVDWRVSDEDLARIPTDGPVVVTANHPFGMVEGLVLIELLRKARPTDFRVMANYILSCYPEMLPNLILVDPFDSEESKRRNLRGIREAMSWLKGGHLLGTFPAGEVAHLRWGTREVVDPPWSTTVGRLVKKTQARVVPVYFDGINGTLFHMMGLIHPILRTALIPREMMKRQGTELQVRVGEPLELHTLGSDEKIVEAARQATFDLANVSQHGRKYTWRDVFARASLKRRRNVALNT